MINVKITDMNTGLPSVSREAQEVVKMLAERKKQIDELKELFGEEYSDYCTTLHGRGDGESNLLNTTYLKPFTAVRHA